jgi:hypothetical protein
MRRRWRRRSALARQIGCKSSAHLALMARARGVARQSRRCRRRRQRALRWRGGPGVGRGCRCRVGWRSGRRLWCARSRPPVGVAAWSASRRAHVRLGACQRRHGAARVAAPGLPWRWRLAWACRLWSSRLVGRPARSRPGRAAPGPAPALACGRRPGALRPLCSFPSFSPSQPLAAAYTSYAPYAPFGDLLYPQGIRFLCFSLLSCL